jgi:glucosamine--fructose-6-phosphate aminotransferase (isomerizing)
VPSERNAHPHISHDGLAIVHNGIIENHEELREELKKGRLQVHVGNRHRSDRASRALPPGFAEGLFKAVRATVAELEGAYALAVVSEEEPERIILAREGCPSSSASASAKISWRRTWRRCCP